MFVKHIIDEDIFKEGFILNPLFNETFSREKIDTNFISTYMQIWLDVNSYRYKIMTDREGTVVRGTINSVDVLKQLTEKYFNNDIKEFIKRNISRIYPKLNNIEKAYFSGVVNNLDLLTKANTKKIMLNLFGESYE